MSFVGVNSACAQQPGRQGKVGWERDLEVFEIAAEAGLIEGGEGEPPPEARAMAQQAAEMVGDMLGEASKAFSGAAQQPQGDPMQQPAPAQQEQAPMSQAKPRGLLGAM